MRKESGLFQKETIVLKRKSIRPKRVRLLNEREEAVNITDIRIRNIENAGKMKAVASITIDDEFVVHDIKIIDGDKGLFIAMPSRKSTDGEYKDIAHPIKSSTREEIQGLILKKYQDEANDIAE